MPEIEWRIIDGFNGLYEVSSDGHVRNTETERLLAACVDGSDKGYLYVHLMDRTHKKKVNRHIHRLVAAAFIENPENKPYVDHIDGDRFNNSVDNLRWCTAKENSNNPVTLNRLRVKQRTPEVMAKYKAMHARQDWKDNQRKSQERFWKPVLDLSTNIAYPSQKAAARATGLRPRAIASSCKRHLRGARQNKVYRNGVTANHFKYITKEEYDARLNSR